MKKSYNGIHTKDITDYIKEAWYDRSGQMIFARDGDNLQMFLDVRGWGRIQQMFDSQANAADFQDAIGEFVTDVINEAIKNGTKDISKG